MRIRPIPLKKEEVLGILAGRQTMLRRPVNMRDIGMIGPAGSRDDPESWGCWDDENGRWVVLAREKYNYVHHGSVSLPCPLGESGDQIWGQETWAILTGNGIRTVYRADADPPLDHAYPVGTQASSETKE